MVKKKKTNPNLQICLPKCCQQPRSHGGTKPRTDFSLFFSASSSSSAHRLPIGSRLDFLTHKDNQSSITIGSMDRHDELAELTLVQCINSQKGERGGGHSNHIEVPCSEIELAQMTLVDTCNNGNGVQYASGDSTPLLRTPDTCIAEVTAYTDVWTAPGSTIWAKTARQMWWPAKIMGGESTTVATDDRVTEGQVLVQYYGNHEFAWLDPAGDLSRFDECFEERSCNPMEAFQEALKQALLRKDHSSLRRQLDRTFDGVNSSSLCEQSSGDSPNKCMESSSSRAEDDYVERGRGKRKRKPKVHFDEVTCPVKSSKKMRRFRIMRHLGLTAPIGSPFSLASSVRIA